LGAGIAAEVLDATAHPAELRLASGLHPPRRAEFLLGRLAARRAQARLGATPGPVLRAARAPRFPPGLVGSISHSGGLGVALAAWSAQVLCLGIDVELGWLPLGAARHVCRPAETSWLNQAAAAAAQRRRLTRLFSAKEALYKALHPLVQAPIRFGDVELTACGGGFRAALAPRVAGRLPIETQLVVRQATAPGLVLSWTIVARPTEVMT
jgi:4'-phosphopantetheinyl transferase EntD